jgi:hypothetical protein
MAAEWTVWAYGDEVAIPGFAVSRAVVYHAAEVLTPDGRLRPMVPGARFRPGPHYRALRPTQVADDALPADYAWTVVLHDDGAVDGAARQQTAFGDPMPHCMCPSDDLVRAYCQDLVADVASLPWVRAVELESLHFGLWPHEWHHSKHGAMPDVAALSTCFCDACCRRAEAAGVDWRKAREVARERVLRSLDGHPLPPPVGPSDYDRVRCETISSLLASLPARNLRLIISGALLPSLWHVGIDPEVWRRHEIVVTLYGDAMRKAEQAHAQVGPFVAGLNLCAPFTDDFASTVSAVAPLVRGYCVYHAGLVPREWLRLPPSGEG